MSEFGVQRATRNEVIDLPAAHAWLETAAAAGDTEAMTKLAFLLANQWNPLTYPPHARG